MGVPCDRNQGIIKPKIKELVSLATLNNNYDVIDASLAKGKWNATRDPSEGDDSGDGYAVGSIWIHTEGHRVFVAEDVAVDHAVWRRIYPPDIDITFPHPAFDVIVRQSGTSVIAEDHLGDKIKSGTVGEDDTEVLQAGADATPDGGVLFIGPGLYDDLVADTDFVLNSIPQTVYTCLLITGGKNIKIKGAGIDNTILRLAKGQNYIDHPAVLILNREAGEMGPGYNAFEVSGMTLDGRGQNAAFDGAALILTGSTRSGGRFHNLKLQNYYTGLYSGNNGSGPETDLQISDIVCENIVEDGVIIDTARRAVVTNIIANGCKKAVNIYGNSDYESRDVDAIVVSNVVASDSGFAVWCINDAIISAVDLDCSALTGNYGLIVHDSIGVKFVGCKFRGADELSGGKLGKGAYITAGMDGAGDVRFSDCDFIAYNALQVLGSAVARAKGCTFQGSGACLYLRDIDPVTCLAEIVDCELMPGTGAAKWNVATGATLKIHNPFMNPATDTKIEDGTVIVS